ncbi:T9SS type A sorting domain-containing protein [Flavobacterium covae]|uniref:T9SS type A sorting domain-containing protein n=1 Tax=Flavobacterium covae TaxID=2906076 RepID=UPI001CE6DB9C|nr:T9SS type A sorting domain-containing protein [Flavobacterium covae]QYS92375.1 T9SS type A sorting domain-containing protein [Flavobacterium covae]
MIFLNPAVDKLNIEMEEEIKGMEIYNQRGQKVFSGNLKQENINRLKNGIYNIKIEDQKGKTSTAIFLKE